MLKRLITLMTMIILFAFSTINIVLAAGGITLYTPYTGISVTPGESIDFPMDILNQTSNVQQVTFDVKNLPQDWTYEMTSGGWKLQQLSVKPNDSSHFSLNVEVPLQVQQGDYSFFVLSTSNTGITNRLPITINVSEKGTYQTELTTEQANMEGHADSTFNYEITLKNKTAQNQHYALKATPPKGWDVNFQVEGKSVTSISADSNISKNINVIVTPSEKSDAGTYTIPITATTDDTTATLELEAVITGKYDMELSTPTGKLSDDITAGREKTIELQVTNTGSVPLHDIRLSANQPANWDLQFEPTKLTVLEPGQSEIVKAKITASNKAIAGDYVITFNASTPEVSSTADFRMTVKTSMLWGWIGVLIIAGVFTGIYYLMRKYGRR